jgi:hypothetical protein
MTATPMESAVRMKLNRERTNAPEADVPRG